MTDRASSANPSPAPPSSGGARRGLWVRGGLGALAVVALIAAARALPVGRWIEDLRGWVDGLGALGMLAFAGAYLAAALLFVPGSALTLAAGALFGPWWGTGVVSVASTSAAALAFLIARHLARSRVEGLAQRHPRFRAVDRAIERGGWRVVGLLRLSPAIPFSAGNYLYGLTGVAFGPYVLASWVAMLPGTFLYVYLGHAGTVAAQAAAGGPGGPGGPGASGGGRTPGEYALLGVGALATVAVTVYVTKLARRALEEETRPDAGASPA